MRTAVALFIFRRPTTTARVFSAIKEARPPVLLIVADGPRAGQAEDASLCHETRAVVDAVDWPCRVLKNYADTNLGCKRRMSSGLDWVFSEVEEAIILEDDCVPGQSFFPFCEELLGRYRSDERVMHIGGTFFLPAKSSPTGSYYFSRYQHVWGWATWRRAWRLYDVGMTKWRDLRDGGWLATHLQDMAEADYWRKCFDSTEQGAIDTWDYQWVFACWAVGGLSAIPRRNLVENIGFSSEATHTKGESPWAKMQTTPLRFPLTHPSEVSRDSTRDALHFRRVFAAKRPLRARVIRGFRRRLRQLGKVTLRTGPRSD